MSQNIENALAMLEGFGKTMGDDELLATFRAKTGAGLHFRNGVSELSYCGVKGTATSGSSRELLGSWSRAARLRLARKAGA